MPIESLIILPGVLFWGGLILGVALQIVLEVRCQAFFKPYGVRLEEIQKSRIGVLTFGANIGATVADWAMVISVIAMALAFVFTGGYGYMCYIFIATRVFSFCLHCVLNGRIYYYAYNQNKIRRELEQIKEKSTNKGER
jgi:hypothetical protein